VTPCGQAGGMSKPKPARYRTTNWSAYNAALRKRGSLLIWLDKEMAWHPKFDKIGFDPPRFLGPERVRSRGWTGRGAEPLSSHGWCHLNLF